MNNNISLTYNFETREDLQLFLIDINNLINKWSRPKKTNDLRGSGTAELHKKVKEYKESNPEKTYRECLKEIAKPKPENNNIV